MSNRDGKKIKDTWRVGKLCPRCGNRKLEKADCNRGDKKHKDHVICWTCKASNF
jgi:hypothetical protein